MDNYSIDSHTDGIPDLAETVWRDLYVVHLCDEDRRECLVEG